MLSCKSFLITYVTQHTYFYLDKHKTETPGAKFSSKEIVGPPTLATPLRGCQRTLMAFSAFSLASKTPTLFGWSVSRTRIRGYCCLRICEHKRLAFNLHLQMVQKWPYFDIQSSQCRVASLNVACLCFSLNWTDTTLMASWLWKRWSVPVGSFNSNTSVYL